MTSQLAGEKELVLAMERLRVAADWIDYMLQTHRRVRAHAWRHPDGWLACVSRIDDAVKQNVGEAEQLMAATRDAAARDAASRE